MVGQRVRVGSIGGWATIRGVRETGGSVVGTREIELALDVSAEGRTYAVTHRQVVSPVAFGALRLGTVLPVEIDPADPDRLTLR